MRAKAALSVVVGALATLTLGASESWSQSSLVQICNKSQWDLAGAITSRPSANDSRWLISGWYLVKRGACRDIKQVPLRSWIYLYAEDDGGPGNIVWTANDQRFCVTYPGPFDRIISDDYRCGGANLKGFKGYFVDTPTFYWDLD
jgi:uncharacterized membrane protein